MSEDLYILLQKCGYNAKKHPPVSDFVQILKKVFKPDREIALNIILEILKNTTSRYYLRATGTQAKWIVSQLQRNGLLNKILGVIYQSAIVPFYNKSLKLKVFPLTTTLMPGEKIVIVDEALEHDMVIEFVRRDVPMKLLLKVYTSQEYVEHLVRKLLKFNRMVCVLPAMLKKHKDQARVVLVNGQTCEITVNCKCLEMLRQDFEWEIIRVNLHNLNEASASGYNAALQCDGKYDKLLKYVALLQPDLLIIEDHFDNYQFAVLLLTIFFSEIPIISIYYDLIHIHLENNKDRYLQYVSEKSAIENSIGIVHRTVPAAIEYLKYHYHINCKNAIDFQPYTSKTLFPQIVIKNKSYPFNLVSAHSIVPTDRAKSVGTLDSDVILLYETVLRQGINVDIYFKGASDETIRTYYSDYLVLQKEYKNLKIHQGIPMQDLIKKLPVYYDFALVLHIDYDLLPVARDATRRFEISGRYYFYVSMGLPIISTTFLTRSAAFVDENDVGLVIHSKELHNLKRNLRKVNYCQLQHNVVKLREELALENQVARLGNFIRDKIHHKTS